jgi:hypothetical protein
MTITDPTATARQAQAQPQPQLDEATETTRAPARHVPAAADRCATGQQHPT